MKKVLQFVLVGMLLVGFDTHVVAADENKEKPDQPVPTLNQIPQSKQQRTASYLELQPSYYEETPLPMQGLAMYYNPGIFERVLKNQIGWGDVTSCEECIGYAALLREGDMDRRIWLQRPGYPPEGPFWVVDQAAPRDVPGLVRRNWVVDVDYKTAKRWGMRGPIPIVVLADPSQALPVDRPQPATQVPGVEAVEQAFPGEDGIPTSAADSLSP